HGEISGSIPDRATNRLYTDYRYKAFFVSKCRYINVSKHSRYYFSLLDSVLFFATFATNLPH
ncbi:hypothetical protein, partial [Oenococcus oeni]|uniref:hypothetical protein n=1 Tax=Oenococcus oeni TaxID=1247 RepID=UPI001C5AE447